MVDLTVIIPSYNTKEILKKCVDLLIISLGQTVNYEIIVVDNGSTDGSVELLKENKKIKLISNKENLGFSKANNQGIKVAAGKYILFLNSDVYIKKIDFAEILSFFKKNKKVGALTVKLERPDGSIDPACHRGFPTIWRSFCYFSKLEKVFGRTPFINKAFGGYHLTCFDLNTVHEIDSPSGAFYLTRKEVVDKVKDFDEDFFMYGEDVDLSFRIKEKGYVIIFYPFYTALHLKYQSGLDKKNIKTQSKTNQYFYESMKIFYQKHYQNKYPNLINKLIYFLIDSKLK